MTNTFSAITRRNALGGLAIAGTIGAVNTDAVAATRSLDLSNPVDYMNALVQMRASLGPRLRMGFIKGVYYGVAEDRITPLYGVLAGTFSKFKARADGTYDIYSFEVAYFTDWNSGELLDTYLNPYTGKTVKVPVTRMGPSHQVLTAQGTRVQGPAADLPGFEFKNRFLPARVVGDDVAIVEENIAGTAKGAKGPPFHYNEVTTLQASLKELSAGKPHVSTRVHFSVVVSWRPWLEMGDMPGHLFGDGTGRHIDRIEDFPPYYVELTRKLHPDAIGEPEAILDRAAAKAG